MVEETVKFCLNRQVTHLPFLNSMCLYSMYSTVNSILHFSYFGMDYLTPGITVTGLEKV
jgi:hypothetical protein